MNYFINVLTPPMTDFQVFLKKFPLCTDTPSPHSFPTETVVFNSKIMLTIYGSRFGNWSVWSQLRYVSRCSWNDNRKFRQRNELCAAARASKSRWNWNWNEDATYWAQHGDESRSDEHPFLALAEIFELSAEANERSGASTHTLLTCFGFSCIAARFKDKWVARHSAELSWWSLTDTRFDAATKRLQLIVLASCQTCCWWLHQRRQSARSFIFLHLLVRIAPLMMMMTATMNTKTKTLSSWSSHETICAKIYKD